jgi:hypothetical protein
MTHGIKSQAFAAGLITTAATGCVAARPGDTYQSDLQAYHACAAAVYNAPEYAALRRHAPSNVNNASLEPLASNDLATDEEIRLLQAAHARVLACRQTFLNAVAQHAPNIAAIDAAIAARTDDAMMALIQKKITWGEYLRQWQAIAVAGHQAWLAEANKGWSPRTSNSGR